MIIDKEIEKLSNANQMITGTERLPVEQTMTNRKLESIKRTHIYGASQLKGWPLLKKTLPSHKDGTFHFLEAFWRSYLDQEENQ
jgi:hypothetical protein